MIKLIAVDIDGTLLGKKRKVTKENIKAIQEARAQGIKIAIATGRHFDRAKDIAREIGIHENQEYVVCLNGGATYKYDENQKPHLIEETLFSIEEVDYIYKKAKEINVNCFSYSEDSEKTFVIKNKGIFIWFLKKVSKRKVKVYGKTKLDQRAFKILACGKRRNMEKLIKIVKQRKFEVYSWSYVTDKTLNIEISPIGVDKKHALKKVVESYGIKPEEVMYFGDGQNDARSIKWAGTGVAMGNASPEIKEVANYITKHHKESGVAHKIFDILENE